MVSCATGTAAVDGLLFVVDTLLFAVEGALFAQHVCPGASMVAHIMVIRHRVRFLEPGRKITGFILSLPIISAELLLGFASRILTAASEAALVVGDGTRVTTRSV